MDTFEASNGIKVGTLDDGQAEIVFPGPTTDSRVVVTWARADEMDALREFFQHERDEELGRWRWPDNPDYVVCATETGGCLVLEEATGHTKYYMHRDDVSVGGSNMTKAARAYFDAHPERKPWHDAKDGETWALTVNGVESAWAFRVREWERVSDGGLLRGPFPPAISAGRRIWPESD